MKRADKDAFEKFLRKHGALRRFKKNLKYMVGVKGTFDSYVYSTECELLIMKAFTWMDTPEGDDFWVDLDNAWEALIDE